MGVDRGVTTKCKLGTSSNLCENCPLKNKADALAKQNLKLMELINLARNEYLELNSDGEHDCVTPYDVYT